MLTVASTGVVIHANQPAGLFYGGANHVTTAASTKSESVDEHRACHWKVRYVEITDYPRFAGVDYSMFPVTFFPPKEARVKHFIDDMVKYKFITTPTFNR